MIGASGRSTATWSPGSENYVERSKRQTIIGGAPSSWSATTEFIMSKDMLYLILGCSNMLWSKKALGRGILPVPHKVPFL